MAVHRVAIEERMTFSDDIDRAKIAATTEEDVQRYMREDGEEPDDLPNTDGDGEQGIYRVTAALVRSRTGLSQTAFAEALGLPVATWRNWEQGRTRIEPAGVALLDLLTKDPLGMLTALREMRGARLNRTAAHPSHDRPST